ncbi:MAG: hypothetical protein AB8F65_13615 [Woeseiaceae bacterium]
MLIAAIIAAIAYGLLKIIPATKSLDGNIIALIALAPVMINFLLGIAFMTMTGGLGWQVLLVLNMAIYFLFPMLWLKFSESESTKVSVIGGSAVLGAAVISSALLQPIFS